MTVMYSQWNQKRTARSWPDGDGKRRMNCTHMRAAKRQEDTQTPRPAYFCNRFPDVLPARVVGVTREKFCYERTKRRNELESPSTESICGNGVSGGWTHDHFQAIENDAVWNERVRSIHAAPCAATISSGNSPTLACADKTAQNRTDVSKPNFANRGYNTMRA